MKKEIREYYGLFVESSMLDFIYSTKERAEEEAKMMRADIIVEVIPVQVIVPELPELSKG